MLMPCLLFPRLTFRHLIRYLIFKVISPVSVFLIKQAGMVFFGLMIVVFFTVAFLFFMAPCWIFKRLFLQVVQSESLDHVIEREDRVEAGLEGWVRIRICPTDEISDLNLGDDSGEWERRVQVDLKGVELDQRVRAWLKGVVEGFGDCGPDSGYCSEPSDCYFSLHLQKKKVRKLRKSKIPGAEAERS